MGKHRPTRAQNNRRAVPCLLPQACPLPFPASATETKAAQQQDQVIFLLSSQDKHKQEALSGINS